MAIPTCLIGLLPGHAVLGNAAAVLLVILRMVQGLSVGGEFTTSAVFLAETAPAGKRGLAASWTTVGASAGTLLGSAVGALLTSVLTAEVVQAWAWRVPFVLGLAVGLAGLYIRQHIPEPPNDRKQREQLPGGPVLDALRTQGLAMLRISALNAFNAVGFYTAFVYLVTYFEKVAHLSAAAALDINSLNMMALLVVLPMAGALSDRIGRKPVLMAAAAGGLIFAWPLFRLMDHPVPSIACLGQLGLALFVGMFCGVMPVTMVEAFPARVRCSAVSIGYNLCLGIIGGTTPLVATWLIQRSHDDLSPAYYVMASAAISLVTAFCLPKPPVDDAVVEPARFASGQSERQMS
jgi:MFS transporter, MHS family, proline/betaine transporter